MEESISGFKRCNAWDEVVEHREQIIRTLRNADVDSTTFDDWNE